MKKFFKSAMLFAAAAMAFTSCSNDDEMNVQPAEQKIDVTVNANIEADTRAEFEGGNGGQFAWVAGDQIVMKYQVPFYELATLNFDGTSFTGTLSNTPNEGKPVEAVALSDVEGSADEFAIKSVQTNKWNGTYNNIANVPFISEPLVFNAGMGNKEKLNMTLNFRHMAAYMQIRFVSDVCAGDAVKSVTFADVNNADVAGQIEIDKTAENKMFSDFVTITPEDVTYTMKKASKVVTLNFQEGGQPTIAAASAQADYNKVAYLMVKPGEYTPKMVVETVGGKKFNIEMTKAKNFVRGNVARIKLNLSADRMEGGVTPEPQPEPGAEGFVKLTDSTKAMLQDGAEFIILDKNYSKVAGSVSDHLNWDGTPLFKKVDVVAFDNQKVVNDVISFTDAASAVVFKFKKNSDNSWSIENNGLYLAPTGVVGGSYMELASYADNNKFKFDVNTKADGVSLATKSENGKFLSAHRDYLAFAKSNYESISIFVKQGGSTTPDPEPQPEVKPIVLTTTPANGETITFAQDAASEQTIVVTIEGGDSSKTYTYEAALSGVNADKFAVNGDKVSTIGANETTTTYEAVLTITVMENGVATETKATINLKQSVAIASDVYTLLTASNKDSLLQNGKTLIIMYDGKMCNDGMNLAASDVVYTDSTSTAIKDAGGAKIFTIEMNNGMRLTYMDGTTKYYWWYYWGMLSINIAPKDLVVITPDANGNSIISLGGHAMNGAYGYLDFSAEGIFKVYVK